MEDKRVSKVSILTGGADKPYNLGLLEALVQQGIEVDFIANDDMRDAAITKNSLVNYFNLRGDQRKGSSIFKKIIRILKYYLKLIHYAFKSDSKIFHIQWYNKFTYFDRVILNLYYKILGKKLVHTAHNINQRQRDGNDTFINRFTLNWSYNIFDHIFVHTSKMKEQLNSEFKIGKDKITVIRFGINNTVSNTDLSTIQAKKALNLNERQKTLLFFGNIAPYKGIEYLILSLSNLKEIYHDLKLVIAGRIKECDEYWARIERIIYENHLEDDVIKINEYIPDEDVEIYFKAADLLVLPYKFVFQSGVIFLSYNFGLPVIASNVGQINEDIIDGKTGYIFEKENYLDLAEKVGFYFESELYKNLEIHRHTIINYAKKNYSWEKIGRTTYEVYKKMI